jgi:hypothetical protein
MADINVQKMNTEDLIFLQQSIDQELSRRTGSGRAFTQWLNTRTSAQVRSWMTDGLPSDKQVNLEIKMMLDAEMDAYHART